MWSADGGSVYYYSEEYDWFILSDKWLSKQHFADLTANLLENQPYMTHDEVLDFVYNLVPAAINGNTKSVVDKLAEVLARG